MKENTDRALAQRSERRVPRYALRKDGEDVLLRLELPGVTRENVEIALEGTQLTVRGKREAGLPEGMRVASREFAPGDFERVFELSDEVATGDIEASYKAGVLELRLARKSPERRTIAVQGA